MGALAKLPKPIQNAISSADLEKQLRALADTHKLHLDQWEKLESEVMLTLLGLHPIEQLGQNIKKEVGVSDEVLPLLLTDVNRIVFEPIRAELERELEHPDAKAEKVSDVDAARTQILAKSSGPTAPISTPVQPATPPPAPPTEKAVRMPANGAYKPGEPSHERKDVHDDPYRETPL